MQNVIELQRATVDEHIRWENVKDWEGVYNTFIQSEEAYYDVVPLATRFKGLSGVKDFYQAIDAAFPDFQITVTGAYDTLGCSIREVTIKGTHLGEYGGVPASGRRVTIELAAFYLFSSGQDAGKLISERIYFDNALLMRQIHGEANGLDGIGLAELSQAVHAAER